MLAIVNVVGSTIAKLADDVLYTWAGPEIAVATTKGYTTQVAVLDLLAVYLARRLGRLDDQRYRALVKAIEQFPSLVRGPSTSTPTCLPWRRSTMGTMTSSSWAGTWTMLCQHGGVAETEGDLLPPL